MKRLLLLLPLMSACVADRDCFLVQHDGADLAVCVEGNLDSPEILLHLAGGPSSVGGWLYSRYGVRQELKKDFLIASMDYRAMGASKGSFSKDTVTVEQLADDANEVVAVLKLMHPEKAVWLHGHSFGGRVGTAALVREQVADGWISEAGCYDESHNDPLTKQRLIDHDPGQVDDEVADEWQRIADEAAKQDPASWEGFLELNHLANQAEGLLGYDYPDNGEQGTMTWALAMPFQYVQVSATGNSAGGLLTEDSFNNLQLAEKLDQITVPALYLAGEFDFICTSEHAAYGAANVASVRSELVIFDDTGHDLGDHYPDEVASVIKAFVRP